MTNTRKIVLRGGHRDGTEMNARSKETNVLEMETVFVSDLLPDQGYGHPAYGMTTYRATGEFEGDREVFRADD